MNKILSLLCLASLLAVPAHAAWRDISASDFDMPAPPQQGSSDYVNDFSILLSRQRTRDPKDCELAKKMKKPDFSALYGPSGLLTPEELASVKPFLDEVSDKADGVSAVFKKRYARPRPFNEKPEIQPCAHKPKGATAYPSSHAMLGVVDACALGKIFPDRAEKLAEWGKYMGELRVTVGVHHPSDVREGQVLADKICSWLLTQKDFNDEVETFRPRNSPN